MDSVRGKLPCPFGDPGIFQKTNTTVRNKRLGREVIYTDLHIHMISSHGFYEGKGSPCRLESWPKSCRRERAWCRQASS